MSPQKRAASPKKPATAKKPAPAKKAASARRPATAVKKAAPAKKPQAAKKAAPARKPAAPAKKAPIAKKAVPTTAKKTAAPRVAQAPAKKVTAKKPGASPSKKAPPSRRPEPTRPSRQAAPRQRAADKAVEAETREASPGRATQPERSKRTEPKAPGAVRSTVEPAKPAPATARKAEAPARPTPAPKPTRGPYADDEKFLEEQRQLLLSERLVYKHQAEDLRAEAESLALEREPGDVQFDEESGEGGTVAIDRERDLTLSAQAVAAVEEIDRALEDIAGKTYGACDNCGQPIPKARLRALPYARLCVACKSGGLHRR